MSTFLYIKAIFDFRLDYLIQRLDFTVRLATWRSCYVTHIVANLGSSTCNLTLSNPCPVQSEVDQVFTSNIIIIF